MIKDKKFLLFLFMVAMPAFAIAQNTLDSLKRELSKARISAELSREEVNRLQYQLAAKEMALRSVEQKDSLFQVLLAIQAYQFSKQYGHGPDIDVYRALFMALKRTKDKMISQLSYQVNKWDRSLPNEMAAMSTRLCEGVKMNMTQEQWNLCASHLPYEVTCPNLKN